MPCGWYGTIAPFIALSKEDWTKSLKDHHVRGMNCSSDESQDVHGFLKQYRGANSTIPHEHIWVHDEAQRAWDAERVQEKRGLPASEPDDFLLPAERMNSWTPNVALIGEGQEIHLGEESGSPQWNDALAVMKKKWVCAFSKYDCPPIFWIFKCCNTIFISGA